MDIEKDIIDRFIAEAILKALTEPTDNPITMNAKAAIVRNAITFLSTSISHPQPVQPALCELSPDATRQATRTLLAFGNAHLATTLRPVHPVPLDFRTKNSVVAAILLKPAWWRLLHPLCRNYPGLQRTDVHYPKIPHSRPGFWHDDLLGVAQYHQLLRINQGHQQRRTVPKYVIIVHPTACVDQEQALRMCNPMLLCVIASQFLAIIKSPGTQGFIMQTVLTGRHISPGNRAQG